MTNLVWDPFKAYQHIIEIKSKSIYIMSILHLSPFPLHQILIPFQIKCRCLASLKCRKTELRITECFPKSWHCSLRTLVIPFNLTVTYKVGFTAFTDEEFNVTTSNSVYSKWGQIKCTSSRELAGCTRL